MVAAYNTTPVSVESAPLVSAAIQNIYVYPNPAQDYVKVYGVPADAILSMYNQQGKKLGQYSWNSTISISQLPAGIFYIAIQSHDIFHVLQFVKQ